MTGRRSRKNEPHPRMSALCAHSGGASSCEPRRMRGKNPPSPFETPAFGGLLRVTTSSLTRLGILDVELSERAGNDEIVVIEHQRPRDAVLAQFKRHRINRCLLAVLGLGVAVVIAHRDR